MTLTIYDATIVQTEPQLVLSKRVLEVSGFKNGEEADIDVDLHGNIVISKRKK